MLRSILVLLALASIAHAQETYVLEGDAFGSVGGFVGSSGLEAGFTVGQPIAGIAQEPRFLFFEESAGLWRWMLWRDPPTDTVEPPRVPTYVFGLEQNYPNPFNPVTTIRFQVPGSDGALPVRLELFDVTGRRIRTLIRGEEGSPGAYTVGWDGRDDRGTTVASGIYFYRLRAGVHQATRRLILSK